MMLHCKKIRVAFYEIFVTKNAVTVSSIQAL